MRTLAYLVLALGGLASGGLAQDPTPRPEPNPKEASEPSPTNEAEEDTSLEDEAPEVPLPIPPAAEDQAAKEILELFKKVDRKLSEIDNMLFDIGAGERPLEAPEDSGLGALLELTRDTSQEVVDDIDRILELAEQMSQQSQSSSGGGGSQKRSSGAQNQGKQGQPKKPEGRDSEGNKPQGGKQDEPQGQEEQPDEPKSPKESQDDPKRQPQGNDQQHPVGAGSQADGTERWGELPERVRETFRNQGGEAAPLYYRDWIDSYYRHLGSEDG